MQFTKYSSIENSYREKYINNIIEQGYGNEEYVVSSKLDGANFSFIYDGKEAEVASRNNVVDGTFFNCSSVIDKYKDSVTSLYNHLWLLLAKLNAPKLLNIQLFGELIGDGINNRVKYCTGREFIVFDLLITTTCDTYYCNYEALVDMLEHFNLFVLTPEHYKGNLRDCLDYCTNNLTFNSVIPKLLNNEYADLEVNCEEGFVIKPVKYLRLKTGDRVILKCKSPEFKENSNKVKTTKIIELTDEENNVLNSLTELVTDSRLYSVTSKLGKLSTNDFGKVLGLYIKDVIEDYSKDNDVNLITKLVNKQLNKRCADCIRSIWLNLLDNDN